MSTFACYSSRRRPCVRRAGPGDPAPRGVGHAPGAARDENVDRAITAMGRGSYAAARAALPGALLQRDPAADPAGGRRGFRDHGTGRVPRHVGHQHDLRSDGAARDRDAAHG